MPLSQRPFLPSDSFLSLLYRFFFFDWLFLDLTKATSLIERHAAWRHNQEMRKYLPVYLRRWGVVSTAAFFTGSVCESVWQAKLVASCFFTGFSVTLAVMAVIVVAWLFLARS